jgi:uncharacterized damage-inducible protein DinB
MKLLTTIQELYQHMEWADALVWQVAATSPADDDETLRARLLHIHMVQRGFLSVWRGSPFNPNAGNELSGAALAAWGREYHREVAQYLADVSEADLDRPIQLPWAEFIAGRIGRKPETPSLGETLLQVATHSSYHRGQVNTRLRELGAEPPLVDFIAWIWLGRPAAQWEIPADQ